MLKQRMKEYVDSCKEIAIWLKSVAIYCPYEKEVNPYAYRQLSLL